MIFNINVGAPNRPVGSLTYAGITHRFDGTSEVNVDGVFRYTPYGESGWKMMITANAEINFDFVNPSSPVLYSVIGAGAEAGEDGGGAYDDSLFWSEGGHGGAGGGRVSGSSYLLSGSKLNITINSATTSLSNAITASAVKGIGITPGAGNTSGNGGIGEYVKYGREDPSYRNATAGGSGVYLFDDKTFDGKLYGAGAGGKGAPVGIGGHGAANGAGWGNEGSGGGSGSSAKTGIVALWYKG